jgi:hypothetical protein
MTVLNATPFFQHFLYSGIAIGINSAVTVKIVEGVLILRNSSLKLKMVVDNANLPHRRFVT